MSSPAIVKIKRGREIEQALRTEVFQRGRRGDRNRAQTTDVSGAAPDRRRVKRNDADDGDAFIVRLRILELRDVAAQTAGHATVPGRRRGIAGAVLALVEGPVNVNAGSVPELSGPNQTGTTIADGAGIRPRRRSRSRCAGRGANKNHIIRADH